MVHKNYYLVITPFFPSAQSFCGCYVYDQIKSIDRHGRYEFIVVKTVPWFRAKRSYEYDGFKVYVLPTAVLPSAVFPYLFAGLSRLMLCLLLWIHGIKRRNVAVVHGHVTAAAIYFPLFRRFQTKTLLQHHAFDIFSMDNGIFGNSKWHRRLVFKGGLKYLNQADCHIGVSQRVLRLLGKYPGVRLRQTEVLYNGVNLEIFHRIPELHHSGTFRIGCIGNFWQLKDQKTLLKAAKILFDLKRMEFELFLIGQGPTLKDCEEYVAENFPPGVVRFLPEVHHNDLCTFYNSLDLFVLPSYYEALGCVYLEAHACGVPFIAVRNQGIEEFIQPEDKSRWLIHKGNAQELADRIADFYRYRYPQKLCRDYDINVLIGAFLRKI